MVENKSDLVFVPITFQELIVIVRNNHPLASHDSIQLSDLQDYTLSPTGTRFPLAKTIGKFESKGLEPLIPMTMKSLLPGASTVPPRWPLLRTLRFLKQFDNLKKNPFDGRSSGHPHDLYGLQPKKILLRQPWNRSQTLS